MTDESPDLQPIVSLAVTLQPGTSTADINQLQLAIRGQPEVAKVWPQYGPRTADLMADDEVVALAVTLAPGIRVTSVIELMLTIRGRPGVADVKWVVERAGTENAPSADRVFADQIMWLLGQTAPV
jgi:hypothetical protein